MVITACKEFEDSSTTTKNVPSEVGANYFDFGENGNLKNISILFRKLKMYFFIDIEMEPVPELVAEKEFYAYLADPDKKYNMLNKYGIVRKGFFSIKYPFIFLGTRRKTLQLCVSCYRTLISRNW